MNENSLSDCPVCGDEYETAHEVEPGSWNVGGRMYHTKKLCYRKRYGEYVVYVHGEEL